MNSRGELVSERSIVIILAIIGFVILMVFLTQLGTEDYSSDEICRLSVLSRATAAEVIPGSQQGLPLQCTTKKVCLSATGKGECPQFMGEKDTINVKLPSVQEGNSESEEQQAIAIEKVMAQSMYDCWNILGQGKLDLFSTVTEQFGFDQKNSTCVICSRIALANDISQNVLNRVDISEYMERNTIPGTSLSYTQTLTNGVTGTYTSAEKSSFEQKDDVKIGGTSTNEIAFVFMQVKAKSLSDVFKNQAQLLGAVAGGAFIAKPSSIIGAGRFLFSPKGLIVVGIAAATSGTIATYNTLRNQDVAVGYCGELTSKSEAKQGCSLLQAIPYSVTDIRNLCGQIEGNV